MTANSLPVQKKMTVKKRNKPKSGVLLNLPFRQLVIRLIVTSQKQELLISDNFSDFIHRLWRDETYVSVTETQGTQWMTVVSVSVSFWTLR